ncbi:hypothetical protein JK205_04065 [Gluconobacter cerinus]|uniref:hypothetical protein n=1 Tax=Gluconobacter cerinus TaxID=38307 RepID=UPI001B8B2178|nr:hypothetical protein [Gluconobacter cerinus]MBS1018113.1 hypothetical protein [Gluconobacter cerinus]
MSKNKRSIPEIRERLVEMSAQHSLPELQDLAAELVRRSPTRRAPRRSKKLTPKMAQDIRNYSTKNPDAHQQDIAEHFRVNHGRVAEALNNEI